MSTKKPYPNSTECSGVGEMETVPITLSQANEFVSQHHRHHGPLKFHKYSIGAVENNKLVGVVIVNRPVNPRMDTGETLEVARLCTDGTKNACSFLYARAADVAKALGYRWIQTYTLADESIGSYGGSLKASGWWFLHASKGGSWKNSKNNGDKFCWVKPLKPIEKEKTK